MRSFAVFATFAFVACAGTASSGTDGGAGNGVDGGASSQCNDIAMQICQKAAACSTGHDGGVTVFLVRGTEDGGINASPFTVNGDVSHCDNFLHLTCSSQEHAPGFIAACGPVVSGLQCGTDSTYGNGIVIPATCGQNL